MNGKRLRIRRGSDRRLHTTVDLRDLTKGTYAVTVDARDAHRKHYRETRRYKAC